MAYQTGSSGANLLFGLGGRVLGGVVGFLAGGPSGAATGWQVGGGVGDSFAKPITMHQTQQYINPADPSAQYQQKKLANRVYGSYETANDKSDWSQYITKGLDSVVNIANSAGLFKKLDTKFPNLTNIASGWFNKKETNPLSSLTAGAFNSNPLDTRSMINNSTRQMNQQYINQNKDLNAITAPQEQLYPPKRKSLYNPQRGWNNVIQF
jgi:hypothetical protein